MNTRLLQAGPPEEEAEKTKNKKNFPATVSFSKSVNGMNVTRSGTESMTSFQATLVNAGYGQLALRDQHGKLTQKWTLGGPKCVIGAHANCNVRCMLPGIADHHLLLVIGSRQIYMRALAAGVERDGAAVNELVLSGDHSQLAFTLAGHRFEFAREHSTMPVARSFVEEGASPAKPEPTKAASESSKRLRFTFVQALEKNRDRSEAARLIAAAAEAAAGAGERPAWVEEIVRDALRPVELRLETIAEPIHNLERQLRRQRARLRKQQQSRKLSRHAAHEAGHSHSQELIQAQETIHNIVADQAARLELVNERVSDIVNQLSSLERIVSAENVHQQEIVSRTSQSGEEIVRLQREMMALVSALQARITEPSVASEADVQWRASIQNQLSELHQSLGILEEVKANLHLAVSQNRQLSQDLESRWQTIEEIAKRPVAIPSATPTVTPSAIPPAIPPSTVLSATPPSAPQYETPAATSSQPNSVAGAEFAIPSAFATPALVTLPLAGTDDQALEPDAAATPVFNDDQASIQPPTPKATTFEAAMLDATSHDSTSLEPQSFEPRSFEPQSFESATFDSPASAGDFRMADDSGSSDPVPLPSWWTEDPAIPGDAYGSVDSSRPEESPAPTDSASDARYFEADPSLSAVAGEPVRGEPAPSADEGFVSGSGWQPSEYEQESGSSSAPWSYGTGAYGEAKNDYPELDVPQLLTSAIAENPASIPGLSRPSPDHSFESKYADQTFDEEILRDVSESVDQSASVIENQLQQWLSDEHHASGLTPLPEADRFGTLEIDPLALEAQRPADESYFPANLLEQAALAGPTAEADNDARHEEYAVSAFSAERLAIEEVGQDLASPHGGQAEEYAPSSSAASYQREADATKSLAAIEKAESPSAEGGDESVEDYMRRLLARMRGVSETEVQLPGIDGQENHSSEAKRQASPTGSAVATSNTASDTQPASGAWTEPFDPGTYVPRVTAPEKEHNLDAMRELANTSARSAINVSARRKHLTAIMIKSGVSMVGLAAGTALVSINGFRLNIGLVATMASFMVALIWGYDALATLRPLLQATRGAKSQVDRASAEESETPAS